jgi:hypothetical protein
VLRVAGVRGEDLVAWVLACEGGRAAVGSGRAPLGATPLEPAAAAQAGGGAGEAAAAAPQQPAPAKAKAAPSGRPVFQGDTPEARFAVFRSAWEGRHGGAARKEMALDRECAAASGSSWASAAPREFRVVHLAAAPPAGR